VLAKRGQLNQPNRRSTDPYARWCDRESPRGPTYVDTNRWRCKTRKRKPKYLAPQFFDPAQVCPEQGRGDGFVTGLYLF